MSQLVLTPLPEFVAPGRDCVLLGEWCRYTEAGPTPFASHPVMESPWLQPGRMQAAFNEAECAVESLLPQIAGYINRESAGDYTPHAWRIVVGPWLQRAVHMFMDRWVHLSTAAERYPGFEAIALSSADWQTPVDYPHFKALASGDIYNHQLMSMVLKEMGLTFPNARISLKHRALAYLGGIRRKTATVSASAHPVSGATPELCESALFFGFQKRNAAMHDEIFTTLDFPRIAESSVAWNITEAVRPRVVFNEIRNGLTKIGGSTEFERAFVRSLPWLFPALYLEGIVAARAQVASRHPLLPVLVVSNNHGWWSKETFKFVAAEAVQRGARVVNAQSSGVHGTDLLSPQRTHEIAVADSYLAWGWGDGGKSRNVPSLYSSRYHGKAVPRSGEEDSAILLLQLGPVSRYGRWLWSCPAAGGRPESYFEFQLRFLKSLPAELARQTLFRFKSGVDNGQSLQPRLTAAAPGVVFETRESVPPMQRMLGKGVRLVVLDHVSTTLFEVLAVNKPAIVFIDPTQTMLEPGARALFEELGAAGAFFTSPEEASAQVAKIYSGADEWWSNPRIQAARIRLLTEFGRPSGHWREEWSRQLASEYRIAAERAFVKLGQ